jgi:hypothetical protein
MQAEVREQLTSLQAEDELITRALVEKGYAYEANRTGGPYLERDARPKRLRSPKRAIFREILSTRPDHPWMPAEIRMALAMREIEANSAAIRALLRRMAEDGEVRRGDNGTGWRLTPANGSRRESLAEATSSGLGEHGRHSSRSGDPSLGAR